MGTRTTWPTSLCIVSFSQSLGGGEPGLSANQLSTLVGVSQESLATFSQPNPPGNCQPEDGSGLQTFVSPWKLMVVSVSTEKSSGSTKLRTLSLVYFRHSQSEMVRGKRLASERGDPHLAVACMWTVSPSWFRKRAKVKGSFPSSSAPGVRVLSRTRT